MIVVGVPRETASGETRVAVTPATATQLIKSRVAVVVEQGAGIISKDTIEDNIKAALARGAAPASANSQPMGPKDDKAKQ